MRAAAGPVGLPVAELDDFESPAVAVPVALVAGAVVFALVVEPGLGLGAELQQRLADLARPVPELELWLGPEVQADPDSSRLDWRLAALRFAHSLLGGVVPVSVVRDVAELAVELVVEHVDFGLVDAELVGVVAGLVGAAAAEL